MIRHPDMFEQFVNQRLADRRLEAQQERLTRLAEGGRPVTRSFLERFLGRVRLPAAASRGAAAALPRTAHPSGA